MDVSTKAGDVSTEATERSEGATRAASLPSRDVRGFLGVLKINWYSIVKLSYVPSTGNLEVVACEHVSMNAALQRRLNYAVALLAGLFAAVLALGYAFFGMEYFLRFLFVLVVGGGLVVFLGFLTADLRRDHGEYTDDA
ncbi:hypothetical protein [Halobacterium zhouii]|uniref:hypothetical protein n=1 Tax=Halobacterium zhouii TaxID=2902624 RepID=UPI001E610688|nr:hypothetical protein [Halobacterium zhouii]